MINLNVVNDIEITNDPFEHIVCKNICVDQKAINEVYNFFTQSSQWQVEQEHQQFNLPEFNDLSTDLVNVFEQFDWKPFMEKLGVTFSRLTSGFTGSNYEKPLGTHTDEPEITGVVAKYLFYMTPNIDNGTILHDSKGNTKTTPGAQGDLFVFKTSPTSVHSSDYSNINKDVRRIILVGCFHA